MKRFARTVRGQRIDQPDFEQIAATTPRDIGSEIVDKLIVGADAARTSIVSGFSVAVSGTQITVNRGVAIVGFREAGAVGYGGIIAEGDATKLIDVNGLSDGAYGIYIRLDFIDDHFQNRLIWDEAATPPLEEPRIMASRRSESWSIAVESVSPGPEWCLIYTFTKAGSSLGTPADVRPMYFEGKHSNSFLITDDEWGGGSDRLLTASSTGSRNGALGGFRRFSKAVLRQLQDIIGVEPVAGFQGWMLPIGATGTTLPSLRNLSQLVTEKLNRDGQQSLTGDIKPDNDVARSLGSTAKRFLKLFFGSLWHAGSATDDKTLIFESHMGGVAGSGSIRVYRSHLASGVTSDTDLFEISKNCWYDNSVNEWKKDDGAAASSKIEYSTNNVVFMQRSGAGPFDETSWNTFATIELAGTQITIGTVVALLNVFSYGDVTADASGSPTGKTFKWGHPHTFKKSIPGASAIFDSGLRANGYMLADWGSVIGAIPSLHKIPGGAADAAWPVELPNGAIITGAVLNGTFTGSGHAILAAIMRLPKTNNVSQSLDSAITQTLDGAVGDYALPADVNNVVDNDNYSYAVWISTSTIPEFYVFQVTVSYTLTQVVLP